MNRELERRISTLLAKVSDEHKWHIDLWSQAMKNGAACYTKPLSQNTQRINLSAVINKIIPSLNPNLDNYLDAVFKAIEDCDTHQNTTRKHIRDAAINHVKLLVYKNKLPEEVLFTLQDYKLRRTRDPKKPILRLKDLELLVDVNKQTRYRSQYSKGLDEVIIYTLFYTGMRVSELVNLKLEHIDFDTNEIVILWSKGGKTRRIGLHKEIKPHLIKYINEDRPESKLDNVFLLAKGKALTANRVEKRLKSITAKAGLEGGAHQFRRGFTCHFADNGVPMVALQQILGHSSIQTTMGYYKADHEQVIKNMVHW